MNKKDVIIEYVWITVGTVIVGLSVFFFLIPSKVSVGSISGLAIVLANYIPFPVSTLTMIMNVVLLLFGLLVLGKDFGVKTIYTSLLLPIVIGIFEWCIPNNQSLTGDQTLDVIGYCMLVSIGLSILFNRNASSGGLDIIAKFLNKFFRMDLGKAMGVAGMSVALSSALVYDTKTVVLSVLGTYFSGIVLDHFIFGSTLKKRVCIISSHYEEILDFILYKLHSGATKYSAYGAYTNKEYVEINTIVDKHEYIQLMDFIAKIDSNAFVTIYAVTEMLYKPKPIVTKK